MLKRLIIIIVLLFVGFLLLIPSINAATGSLTVNCDKQVVVSGDTITCSMSATTDFSVYDMEIPFTLSTGLTAQNFVLASNSNMMGDGIDGGKIGIFTSSDIPAGTFALGTFTIKVGNNISNGPATIKFSNIKFGESEKIEHSLPDLTITLNSSNSIGSSSDQETYNTNVVSNSNSNSVNSNPRTGSGVLITTLMLFVSFIVSICLYKKNVNV